jgi:hypothetical protein
MEDDSARSHFGWSLLMLLEILKALKFALREADRCCTVQRLLLLS